MKFIPKCFLCITLLTVIVSCNKKEAVSLKKTDYKLIQEDYSAEWSEISDLERKGYGKTIIQKVDTILLKAKDSENYHQVFKALAYRAKYISQIEEESTFKILSSYETEIKEAEFPLKNILHSALGELYNQYLSQNTWRFQDRSQTELFDPEDLRTWSIERINQKASEHYDSSLTKKENLILFPTSHLYPIINPTDTNNHLCFSGYYLHDNLFDLLANRALNFYKNPSHFLNKPANEFQLDQLALFSKYDDFISIQSNHSDSLSPKNKTFKLWQNLMISSNKGANDKKSFVNLERLKYYHQISLKVNKDQLYENALLRLKAEKDKGIRVSYYLADFYFQKGKQYNYNDTANRWMIQKAYSIVNSTPEDNSFEGKKILALKSQIESKSLSFQIEQNNLPDNPILFKIDYKNISTLFARIVKSTDINFANNNYSSIEERAKKIVNTTAVLEKELKIIDPKDFQSHSTEQFIDGLEIGDYYLILSSDKNFNSPTSEIAFQDFKVTELSIISRENSDKNGTEIFVLNRRDGKPISNINIQSYFYTYDYEQRKQIETPGGKLISDKSGHALFEYSRKNKNFFFKVKNGNDEIETGRLYNRSRGKRVEKTITSTKLFTDRAIYRPGQTIHFKGIIYQSLKNNHQLKTKHSSTVKLLNVNNQVVSEGKFISNDYGSFEGSFILPNSGLTGHYRIVGENGSVGFRVEEYKRPSFKVEVDSLSGELELNQTIDISGKIIAFAGNPISDAKVTYRVIRNAEFPYWHFYRGYYPSSPEKEIATGEILSNGKGVFQFNFLAQADANLTKDKQPIYNYNIIIDAVSPNGETQSKSKTVRISNSPFILKTNIGINASINEVQNLNITCENLNGKSIEKKGVLKLVKLKSPNSPSKPKFWNDPIDLQTIDRKVYYKLFPQLSESSTNNLDRLSIEYEVSNSAFECNKTIKLFKKLIPGAYELSITVKGNDGQTTTQKNRFILFDKSSNQLAFPTFYDFKAINTKGEPGENAQILIASSLNKLKLLYEIEHEGRIISKQFLTINQEQKLIEIPIKEKYRGGFTVHFIGVHSNRIIKESFSIDVPFTNKKLNLKLTSFRDKVKPASKEEWSIQVSGMDNTKVQSELLLSMYDQSLDQFSKTDWNLNPYRNSYSQLSWNSHGHFSATTSQFFGPNFNSLEGYPSLVFPKLNWFGFSLGGRYYHRGEIGEPMMMADGIMTKSSSNFGIQEIVEDNEIQQETTLNNSNNNGLIKKLPEKAIPLESINPIRTNFNETAFFYPQVKTAKNGKTSFKFTMPDALTEWKFRAFAHSKSFATGNLTQSIRTQKELMVFPNAPRFFREGDLLELSSLISNLSDTSIEGIAKVRFFDSFTNQPIQIVKGTGKDQSFFINQGENQQVSWTIKIPENIKAITYRIIAETKTFSDGEEKAIPVLHNRVLVTESLPLAINANEEKSFTFEKLVNSETEKNLTHYSLSLEYTPNPVWYAVQALPYLATASNECSEQIFTRLFANSIAEHIAKSQPQIQKTFEQWKTSNSLELNSKLEQNQELKTALIEETPWLKEAKSESEQKRRIALLFDFNKMASEKDIATKELLDLQSSNGGWAWYKGMRDNRYITQYIVSGFGHLNKLGINNPPEAISKAIKYLDNRIQEDYNKLLKHKSDLNQKQIGNLQIQYLYARSFFQKIPLPKDRTAFDYYLNQAKEHWVPLNNYMKGMTALAVNRFDISSPVPKKILISLEENSIRDEEMGMYWKDNVGGYYWQNAKIETQALLIEAFDEIFKKQTIVNELKLWLLKQKQTQAWSTSKSTAEACYALLMRGDNLIQNNNQISIQIGKKHISSNSESQEAGTGYFKTVWNSDQINPQMGNIVIQNINKSPAWGAIYWQYYQKLNNISAANETGLTLTKTLFKEVIKENGPMLTPIIETDIQLGDKIVMRLRIETDRDIEFVHLKDMRASGFEPINVLSGYRFQDGIGYYESTKDASSNFYMDYLSKGVYVFEYAVRATIAGEFSNGISSIQCQYAPEFNSHSKGQQLKIVR